MATPFSDIYDLSLTRIADYVLDNLFFASVDDFEAVMQGYLMKAIPKFTNCTKDLSLFETVTGSFNADLSLNEKVILSDLLVNEWMMRQILDVTQFRLKLNDTDFKHYAESQNLTGKMNAQNSLREQISQDMINYGVDNIPWKNWSSGNYGNY